MQGTRHGFLARTRRTGQQQRLGARCLPRDRVAEGANRRALADQRPVHTAARMIQEILGDAQLALERRRPFGDPRFERRIGRLQRVGGPPPLVVQLRVADRARDLVRDDCHQAAIVLVKGVCTGLSIENTPTSSSRMRSGIAIWLSAFGKPGTVTASPISASRPALIICRRCADAYARCCPRLSSCRIFRLCATTPTAPMPTRTRPPIAWFS